MATTKTLTPTNQTISIPELTDSPDMSVPADAIDKEADAINTLNSKIAWPTLTADLSGVSSVATFKSAYSSVGLYYNAPSSSQRTTLVNLGLLPKNYAGLLTVIKYSDTLFYMEYYLRVENSKYFAFIENNTVSSWEWIAVKSDKMDVQPCGSWNGNQSVESLKTAVTQTGFSITYLQDATYGNGWSLVTAKVDGNYKFITIHSPARIIYMYTTTGSSWGISSCALS